MLLLQQLLIFHDDASRWFNKHVPAKIANLYFGIFLIVLCSDIKDKVNPFFAVTLNGWKLDMLIYPDHLENWLDFDHRLLIFFILAAFWLSETGQISDFRAFS